MDIKPNLTQIRVATGTWWYCKSAKNLKIMASWNEVCEITASVFEWTATVMDTYLAFVKHLLPRDSNRCNFAAGESQVTISS